MFGLTTTREAARQVAEVRSSLENPQTPLSDVAAWRSLLGEWHGVAGVTVTYENALSVPAVWCAVNFLSSTVATLPLQVFTRGAEGRVTADKDPLYSILHDAPNAEWTSAAWRKYMMVAVLTRGRGITFIEKNKAGRVMNLWPLDIDNTTIERVSGRKQYRYREGGREIVYAASEIIDVPFMLASDGVSHVSPIEKLKGCIGLALALERYATKFFDNGGVPPLALHGPMPSPGAASRAAADVTKAVRDANDERRNVLIVPSGHVLKSIGIEPNKSQMEGARRFQIEEIARAYSLPPVFLGDLTKATFSNGLQQDLAFSKHCLTPWLEAIEQELNLKLFPARNRTKFVEFNQDALLRGDFETRMKGWALGIQNALVTPDEARESENWPSQGGDAKLLHIQGATVPLGAWKEISKAKSADAYGAPAATE